MCSDDLDTSCFAQNNKWTPFEHHHASIVLAIKPHPRTNGLYAVAVNGLESESKATRLQAKEWVNHERGRADNRSLDLKQCNCARASDICLSTDIHGHMHTRQLYAQTRVMVSRFTTNSIRLQKLRPSLRGMAKINRMKPRTPTPTM